MLDRAMSLLGLGLAVFPVHGIRRGVCTCGRECDSPGKHPVARLAPRGLKDATTDAARIEAWWCEWRDANPAVATGAPSGCFVLDVDGEAGRSSLTRLVAEHGALPDTWETVTGSGGRHVWFRHPGGHVPTRAPIRPDLPGLDVRGDGGYVVAAGARHASGGTYEWDAAGDPEGGTALADAPAWLTQLLTPPKRESAGGGAVARGRMELPAVIEQGGRDETLFRYAASLRGYGAEEAEILDELLVVNAERVVPPLPYRDLERIARSAASYEANRIPGAARPKPSFPPPPSAGGSRPPAREADPSPPEGPQDADEDGGDGIDQTDVGNAIRFEMAYTGSARYVIGWDRWIVWDRHVWREDTATGPYVRALAHELTESMMATRGMAKYARSCRSSGKVSAMIREASARPGLGIRSEDLDAHDHLLAVENGIVDLRDGRLLPPDPDLLITRAAPWAYDPDATCPHFERFLTTIMKDRDHLVDFLVRAFGYTVTGETREHVFFIPYGRGRNGKGTIARVFEHALGLRLVGTVSKRLLHNAQSSEARFEAADLEGLRCGFTNETSETRRLDAEFLKEVSAADRIRAERKGKDPFSFVPKVKIWYGVNKLPKAQFDSAFGSRVVPVPFDQSFYNADEDEYREGDLPRDDKLFTERLMPEMPGILAFLVRAAGLYYEHGLKPLPTEILDLKRTYQQENDPVGEFLEERTERCEANSPSEMGYGIRRSSLYEAFTAWMKRNDRRWYGDNRGFVARLAEETDLRIVNRGNVHTVANLRLRQDAVEEDQ